MGLPDQITEPLEDWLTAQRWFASKAREVASANVLQRVTLSESPALELHIVEARFQAGTHELYQLLPATCARWGPSSPTRRSSSASSRC
jgi:hypothetical protein